MSVKRILFGTMGLIAAVALAAGCSSALKEGETVGAVGATGFGTDPVSGIAYVGAGECVKCHQGFSWSAALVQGYLAGKHVVHSNHITALEVVRDGCTCHDPIGDGRTMEAYTSSPAAIPADGLAAVTCETCHGAGGEHWGNGPIPVAKPGPDACGACHGVFTDLNDTDGNHRRYHPEGQGIATKFALSQHWKASVRNEPVCAKCHTDEGAKLYKDVMTRAGLELLVLPVPVGSPVQCRTCHDPHQAGALLKGEVEDHGVVEESSQYATCTNCHGKPDAVISTDPAVNTLQYHEDRYFRIIADSHYDDPATLGTVEGYILGPTNEHVCLDCHDVHAVRNINNFDGYATINEQWAKSAHGGFIGMQKGAVALSFKNAGFDRTTEQTVAIRAAGATEESGPAWVHYPWTHMSRKSCAQCHTASGVRLFLTDPSTYAANLPGLYTTTGPTGSFKTVAVPNQTANGKTVFSIQKQLLYCWGCHADNSGALRGTGPIEANYDMVSSAGTLLLTNRHTYPDIRNSNPCLACHVGRENGDSIKNLASAGGVTIDFTNLSFINSHYLSAGGTLFGVTGYEFTGQTYGNYAYFEHDKVGLIGSTSAAVGGTRDGPCTGCHMSTPTGHTWQVVSKNPVTGSVASIRSTVCASPGCHAGTYALTPLELEENKEMMEISLMVLKEALKSTALKPAFFFSAANPYFFKTGTSTARSNAVKNWNNTGDLDATGNSSGKNNMGAAFNFNLLHHDPGAYAHNRLYARLLIFDSLDWLDNNAFDGVIDLSAYAGSTIAAGYLKGRAITVSEVTRPTFPY